MISKIKSVDLKQLSINYNLDILQLLRREDPVEIRMKMLVFWQIIESLGKRNIL